MSRYYARPRILLTATAVLALAAGGSRAILARVTSTASADRPESAARDLAPLRHAANGERAPIYFDAPLARGQYRR